MSTTTEAMSIYSLYSDPFFVRRRARLGRVYDGATKEKWKATWRQARIHAREGVLGDSKIGRLAWRAQALLRQRHAHYDPLSIPIKGRIASAAQNAEADYFFESSVN